MDEMPEQWAERRDGLVSMRLDGTPGVNRRLLKTRVRTKRWKSVRRNVAAIRGTPPTWRQSVRAAVLAAGERAFASHLTAPRLYGIDHPSFSSESIHLSADRDRHVRMLEVCSHRFKNLEDGDVVDRWGIRTASPLRTVIDLSGHLSDDALGRLIDEFLRRKLLSIGDLHERVPRLRPAPGRSVKRLQRLLLHRPVGHQPGDSALEARILMLLAASGFPQPISQFWVRREKWSARIDHAYPEVMLYLESDGFGWHQFASDLDNDARRRNHLVLEGWRPLSFTWRMTDSEILATMDAVYDRVTGGWKGVGPQGPRHFAKVAQPDAVREVGRGVGPQAAHSFAKVAQRGRRRRVG